MKTPFLLGRIRFGDYFLYNGFHHFRKHKNMAQYVSQRCAEARSGGDRYWRGIGSRRSQSFAGDQAKVQGCGFTGIFSRASPIMHDFWNMEELARPQQEMINFTKNVALAGATVALMEKNLGRPVWEYKSNEEIMQVESENCSLN